MMIKLINKKMLSIYDKYTFNICIIYIKFVYLTIHDTIKKNLKSIHYIIQILTIMYNKGWV